MGPNLPAQPLLNAMATMTAQFRKHLDWDDVYSRYNLLRERYQTFKWVLAFHGADWDNTNNRVFYSDETWSNMFEVLAIISLFQYYFCSLVNHYICLQCV